MIKTTDIVITCTDEREVIEAIAKATGLDFQRISYKSSGGGSMPTRFTSWAAHYSAMAEEDIVKLIEVFEAGLFNAPELVTMIIDDDESIYSGVHWPKKPAPELVDVDFREIEARVNALYGPERVNMPVEPDFVIYGDDTVTLLDFKTKDSRTGRISFSGMTKKPAVDPSFSIVAEDDPLKDATVTGGEPMEVTVHDPHVIPFGDGDYTAYRFGYGSDYYTPAPHQWCIGGRSDNEEG